jgi:predicted RNA polymerase sigma factor
VADGRDRLLNEPTLERYHLLPSVRGDLLAKLGRAAEARLEFERAASLTRNIPERRLLLERAKAQDTPGTRDRLTTVRPRG